MTHRVRLYIDEVKGKDFFIHACLFSDPHTCDMFESEIRDLVERNRNILGKDFKGFHARDLNQSNWIKLAPIYDDIVRSMFTRSLGIHFYLESKNKHERNSEALKKWFRVELESNDDTNKIRQAFKALKPEDFPVLYHRLEMLYVFLIHKDKYGKNCEFEIYPDSSGKVLDYIDKSIEFTSSNRVKKTFDFFQLFDIVTNALAETLDEIGFLPSQNQKVIKFSPTNDIDSFLIQSCDIIANFLIHYLRFKSGINDNNTLLKSGLFSRYFILNDGEKFVKSNFGLINNEIYCTNPEMKKNYLMSPNNYNHV